MAVGPVLASAGGKGKYRRRVQTAILLPFNIIIKSNLTFVRTRYYEKPNLLVGKLYQRFICSKIILLVRLHRLVVGAGTSEWLAGKWHDKTT